VPIPSINGQLPRYTVAELNEAVAALLQRGFAPRFLLEATVSRPQQKKGHLWLTLSDGKATVSAVVWASQLQKLDFVPSDGDGVLVVGKLNFWTARASIAVQVLDLRPSLSAVMRQFERVHARLAPEGLFDPERKRPLPRLPGRIALLTSTPSSALADMLRTARDRWPATGLLVVPIPVQGAVESRIRAAIDELSRRVDAWGVDAIVLARGGGSREDLTVFDSEGLARCLATCPVPVVCGLGHEDDITIADLVADHRAATPTAAIVALLPDRITSLQALFQNRRHLHQLVALRLRSMRQGLDRQKQRLQQLHPHHWLAEQRQKLKQKTRLLHALSPRHLLARGFSLLMDSERRLIRSVTGLRAGDRVSVQLVDGSIEADILRVSASSGDPTPSKG
jgi:exodeoxyribonuclease VII large subunit